MPLCIFSTVVSMLQRYIYFLPRPHPTHVITLKHVLGVQKGLAQRLAWACGATPNSAGPTQGLPAQNGRKRQGQYLVVDVQNREVPSSWCMNPSLRNLPRPPVDRLMQMRPHLLFRGTPRQPLSLRTTRKSLNGTSGVQSGVRPAVRLPDS